MSEDKRCPIEATLSLINGKWKLIIMKELSKGPVRYGVLEKALPVSAKVLTQQLRELEGDGLIVRTVFPEVPPRVEYALADKGVSIYSVFSEMRRWGIMEGDSIDAKCRGCKNCIPSDYYRKNTQA